MAPEGDPEGLVGGLDEMLLGDAEGPAVVADIVAEFEEVGGDGEFGLEAGEGGGGVEADVDVEDEGVGRRGGGEEFLGVGVVARMVEERAIGGLNAEHEHIVLVVGLVEEVIAEVDGDVEIADVEGSGFGDEGGVGGEVGDDGFSLADHFVGEAGGVVVHVVMGDEEDVEEGGEESGVAEVEIDAEGRGGGFAEEAHVVDMPEEDAGGRRRGGADFVDDALCGAAEELEDGVGGFEGVGGGGGVEPGVVVGFVVGAGDAGGGVFERALGGAEARIVFGRVREDEGFKGDEVFESDGGIHEVLTWITGMFYH